MTLIPIEQFILYSLSLLFLATLLGMVVAWGWAFQRIGAGAPITPQHPIRPLPTAHWGGKTVLLVAALFFGTSFAVGQGYSALRAIRGGKAHVGAEAAAGDPDAEKGAGGADRLTPLEIILLTCAANVAFCAVGYPLLRRVSDVGAANLGVFEEQWPLQVWFGVVAALLAIPATYAIQLVATTIWTEREHEVQKMMMDQFTPAAAALAFFATVILAPVVEETLFRGFLQRWLTRLFDPRPHVEAAETADSPADEANEPPPPSVSIADAEEPGAPLAIVVTSIIFAGMHGAQWPAPVALFALSLVLGGLYQKTGSLLSAMIAHGVFNGFSTLLLIAQLSAHHLKG